MRSDLDKLLEALYEKDSCEPEHRLRWQRDYDRLLEDALARVPRVSRQQLQEALADRYRELKKRRRQNQQAKLPPRA
jgi:hypothetical protein